MEKITGIILSGGLAKRFQTNNKSWIDKATIDLNRKPILIRLIEILKSITDEILIIVNDEKRRNMYIELLKKFHIQGIKIYIDEVNRCKGPLLAILTGISRVNTDYCLILPCDLPYIKIETLRFLIENSNNSDIALFIYPNGEIEPLPVFLKVKSCWSIIKLICGLGKRRIDDIYRACANIILIPVINIQNFDSNFQSFINMNYPHDLEDNTSLQIPEGPIKKNIQLYKKQITNKQMALIFKLLDNFDSELDLETTLNLISELKNKKFYFWIATLYEYLGKYYKNLDSFHNYFFKEAANQYLKESVFYSDKGISFLEKHAKLDENWCLSRNSG